MFTKDSEKKYINILKEELLLATGCTEPISIAYCAAILKDVLGEQPEKIVAKVSGNILKNVKSVVVPNTGGLKGLLAAISAGIVAGCADAGLQVIASVPVEKYPEIKAYMQDTDFSIECPEDAKMLDIFLYGYSGNNSAAVRIANSHSNVIYIEKNGEAIKNLPLIDSPEDNLTDKTVLNVKDIVEFANNVDLAEVSALLDNQAKCNTAIAEEGLSGDWGAGIGKLIFSNNEKSVKNTAKAYAAAASDARMSGCEMPVVIVSGSGNQGITASMPVVQYALSLGVTKEKLYRALLVSNLVTIHQKTGIGRLSAYCGAVSAGCGAGAGIAYLHDAGYEGIAGTINNAVAILSGMICDGAKPSCAAKIASAVEAGILGYEMYLNNHSFSAGDGIVGADVEKTIENVGVLARNGMRTTDRTILEIMTRQ
ncbi:MAG: serine dehydratase subunit alpha family protein [Oscillospiraceae bacterium]|nr:serine dehydratase subunit alpha family protein [Oscillospiraceae bacterium]